MDVSTIVIICIVALVTITGGYMLLVWRSGATRLHMAAADDEYEIAFTLLAGGANPNKQCRKGRTPLFQAILTGSPSLVELLLNHGTDPNIADHNGEVSLHHVSSRRVTNGTTEIISSLIKHGANHDIRNKYGDTPQDRSIRLLRMDIANAIEQKASSQFSKTKN